MELKKIRSKAPGRINIIGEHTDYNGGFVLPAAIDKAVEYEISENGTEDLVTLEAIDLNETFTFSLSDFQPLESGWQNYLMGVVHELQKKGAQIRGFYCRFTSDIPIGSGMSSSAGLECGLAVGLNELFDLGFNKWELIKVGQLAEHNFVGTKCGIMDQFASVMGKKDHVMKLDCRSLEFDYFPLDLKEYDLLLLNTNVSHSLASSEYNTRRAECEKSVEILNKKYGGIETLRDVSMHQLNESKYKFTDAEFRRCRHVIGETDRVSEACEAMEANDFDRLGQLIYASHRSLQHDYEVSCKELDFLVDLSEKYDEILGARMMGGGFGGCTINLIKGDFVNSFITIASKAYKKEFDLELTHYKVKVGEGAQIINNK